MTDFIISSKREFLEIFRNTLCASFILPLVSHASTLELGGMAPTLDLPGIQGRINLADFKGKVIYLDFWASWCGPCRKSFPWMNDLQKKYADQGLVILGVNLDANPEDAHHFLQKIPANFRIAFDAPGDTPKRFGVQGMPTSVIINRDGKLVEKHTGFNDKTGREVEDKLIALFKKTP